jgi:predicted DNA-binding transcriptional regulator YafY
MRLLSSAGGPLSSSLNQHGGADHDHSTHLPTQSPTQSELGDPVQAVAHGQQRQEAEQAEPTWVHIKALEQALVPAAPEGHVRIFIDEGAPMAALLHQAATYGIGPGHVTTLLAAFGDQRPQE